MVSAIVINWNGRAYVERCLGAVLGQDPPPEEVLLVDNASDDGSRELVAERFPAVRIVDAGGNVGPARARNLGVDAARSERCLLLDNDVILQPGALAALGAVLDVHPRTALVQARSLCGDDPERVHYDHADLHFLGTLVLHNWLAPRSRADRPSTPVGAAIALCVLTRRSVYREIGGFDERMFILYEDNELSWRLRMCGHEIRLAPDALCLHLGGTAGLSVRGPRAAYPARRAFLHARNRWLVLLSCMRWRTLLLTAPSQVLYAMIYLGFAASRGHLLAALHGHWQALCSLPHALARRRSIQGRRTVPDRELLVAAPMTLNQGLAERGARAALRRGLDALFACNWRLVRRLCG